MPENASSEIVRRRLRVAYFLEGSVRVIGDDIRVVVQLIESATGFHVFSRSFDSKLDDYMDVQRDITNLAVANLRVALPEDPNAEALLSGDEDPELDAYVLYRRGKATLDGTPSIDAIQKANVSFAKALAIDPEYSAAHAGMCDAYVLLYELTKDESGIELAESACTAALSSSPNLDIVYSALGRLRLGTGEISAADDAFRRALAMNPNNAGAVQGIATILQMQQQLK